MAFLQKLMNIFTGDLYSMYVVLQAIGSPSCMIIIYIIPFGEQQSWMSEVRKKTGPTKCFFFIHWIKKNEFFKLTEGYPPRPVSGNYDQTHIFAMKANKMNEYFHRGPIFYVCSSERNFISSTQKGVYDIRNSVWGVATLDVWSS